MVTTTPIGTSDTTHTEGEVMSAATAAVNSLTTDERSVFTQLEETIQAGQKAFFEVGAALKEIRDSRFYRDEFNTFEEYCQKRWSISKPYATQTIQASDVQGNLVAIATILPANESQCRPLTKLPSDRQQAAWIKVLSRAPENDTGEKQVTAKLVAEVVREVSGATRKDSANRTSKPAGKTHSADPPKASASPRSDEAQLSRLTKEEVLNGATLTELLEAVRAIDGDAGEKSDALLALAKELDPQVVTSSTPQAETLPHDDDLWSRLTNFIRDMDITEGFTNPITAEFTAEVAKAAVSVDVRDIRAADAPRLIELKQKFFKALNDQAED